MLVLGIALILAGIALATWAARIETQASAGRVIPLWKIPDNYRRQWSSALVQVAAIALTTLGAVYCLTAWGSGALLLIALPLLPAVVVVIVHNRSVRGPE